MINFDDEIKKFQPSLEVEDAEEEIYKTESPDIIDILGKIIDQSNQE